MLDLGGWLGERYRIPGEPVSVVPDDEESSS